ncbi:50S ribosomal protein L1 [Candidatus Clavichlamydia salmonicola]|uniref:50S ribosomal protein L1 n=1 Tax=Candidatus Clavichlamydia salmonicola TaxID=469812 RepID=UPI001890D1A9|nr:50S ribosomal protein L1 [Candidatus Clavichlamydia salmonicola]MBF5051102.1 50S ribosomal protein L1 [Candidatus Clavichlamydia salmonicola]
MTKKSKRIKDLLGEYNVKQTYSLLDAIKILKASAPVKFDQTIDVSLKIGVDPKRSDQQVRGPVFLPHGTGKKLSILVFASGDRLLEAIEAGAEFAGNDDLIEKIKGGWTDFDAVVATPDMMREIGKIAKILGPRGLMPSPKSGTVTTDISKAIAELKKGKIEFRLDRNGVCNAGVGKLSFSEEALNENIKSFIQAVLRARPASAKGQYLISFAVSSTMGLGLRVDLKEMMSL